MQAGQTGIEQLKQRMRATWMAGDFGQVAKLVAKDAEEFVGRLGIASADRVLDVACGTGNCAIPAGRTGARVTGIDIAPNLLDQAKQRAVAEGLKVTFDEGDAEHLPYPDGQFDVVITMFGAMFAPKPERTAAEMARVCRSGGRIAMANWTPGGFVGKMFKTGARFVPPPDGLPSPVLWGDERTVTERLTGSCSEVRTTRRTILMDYPFGPGEVVQFFRQYFGPTVVAFSKLDAEKQAEYAAELERLWTEHNEATGNRTVVPAEYLEVVATRA